MLHFALFLNAYVLVTFFCEIDIVSHVPELQSQRSCFSSLTYRKPTNKDTFY